MAGSRAASTTRRRASRSKAPSGAAGCSGKRAEGGGGAGGRHRPGALRRPGGRLRPSTRGLLARRALGASPLRPGRRGQAIPRRGAAGVVGILAHLFNGALLGLLYAGAVYPWAARDGALLWRLLAGAGYGVVVWVVLLNLLVFPLAGAGPFGWAHGGGRLLLATLFLHLIYGLVLGAIYYPAR